MARKQAAKQAVDPLLLGNQICFAVYSTAHAFNRVYKPLLDRLGLTYPQYLVMLVLWERDDVPLKDIGEKLFLDSGTLTPLLKRLEASGLIRRTRSTEDERQVLIALTPQGRALREEARAVPQAILSSSACSVGELVTMKNELIALRDKLNAALGE
jgi:DNA-binding MarR family transcriptional regulator